MTRHPVPVALVGLGAIGLEAHLPALLRSPDVEVAALVDPEPARRQRAAQLSPGVPTFADLAPVLADPHITAVVLATPPWVTTELARQVLGSGRYCLAEKPLGVNSAHVRALMCLDESARARLQVGLTYRHDPAMATLREWISAGTLGTPLLVRAHIYDEPRRPADEAYAARILATMLHAPPIVHEGAHVFDWLSFVLGEAPVEIEDAWAMATEPGLGHANVNGARLSWPDGTRALVEVGWWTDAVPRCELSFLGRHGEVRLDVPTFRLYRRTSEGCEVVEFPRDRTERSFDRQLARFVDLVTGRVQRATPGLAEGLASLELSERITEYAKGAPR